MERKYGLLGEKLGQSFSKKIHSLFGEYQYDYYPVDRDGFIALFKSGELSGMNVTIPYKELAYSLCDELSETAVAAGCVNTVTYRDGVTYGDNTDVFGFMYMLSRGGISLEGKNVIVLGSGGTSKTARCAAGKLGAKKISVVSRSGEINYDNVYDLSDTQIVINTTPLGMYPKNGECALDISRFPLCEGVADVVYNPLKTKLMLDAKRLGIKNVGGIYMLVAQAHAAAERFLDESLPEELIENAVLSILGEVTNIVLIGMPGSGKTTVGRALAEKLSKKFYDTDEIISSRTGLPCGELLNKVGEEKFRELECEVVAEVSKETGVVISTGGGVVERAGNRDALCQNGKICYIERELSSLATDNRPLSKNVFDLFEKRKEKYAMFADVKVSNNACIEETIREIIQKVQ